MNMELPERPKPSVRFSDDSYGTTVSSVADVPLKETLEKTDLPSLIEKDSTCYSEKSLEDRPVSAKDESDSIAESSDSEEERVIDKPKKVEKTPKEQGILPARFSNARKFQGYGVKIDALYRTTASDYGSRPPTELTMPSRYYGFTRKFTTHLSVCGMYRNHSVNSKLDK
uniref:UPF0691 protein C9orf116 homolog n=1 Tax=Styela clava TaxID=7725 RepID=UPI0019393EA3|nr:UPF0691 protein C9orf116 homolog [Styela clava]